MFKTTRSALKYVPLIQREYGLKYGPTLLRFLQLTLLDGFSAKEVCRYGMLDPEKTADPSTVFMPGAKFKEILYKLNDPNCWWMSFDKVSFGQVCAAYGLPAPKVLAVIDYPYGWNSTGQVFKGSADVLRFLHEDLPNEFIVKPATGYHGRGVTLYKRLRNGFESATGTILTDQALLDTMFQPTRYFDLSKARAHGRPERIIIQERIRNHADLIDLSRTEYLQTLRICTFLSKTGEVQVIPDAYFRAIGADAPTDNFVNGSTGNIACSVSIEDGRIKTALKSDDGLFLKKIANHPKSGLKFSGFQIPYWRETIDLVKRAAPLFWPLKSLGWDIAITQDGPMLTESNVTWDPIQNAYGAMNGIVRAFADVEPKIAESVTEARLRRAA
ncbi:MAG TPA: sugar-transfer associated ATP-grasp domain-containing protein [Bdellovibrionales bacterium]|nr:sugar-transfer associated ATP-grasp domain-containing protein [Bdellovibrionales bacterium]